MAILKNKSTAEQRSFWAHVELIAREVEMLDSYRIEAQGRDACEVCHGWSGGVPGNENILDGVTVCDYCCSTVMNFFQAKEKKHA